MSEVLVVYDEAMLAHVPDGYDPKRPEWTQMIKERLGSDDEGGMSYTHPERPERLRAVIESLEQEPVEGLSWASAEPADEETKALVHTDEHIDCVESYRGRSGWLHHDTTAVSEGSVHAADVAVGAAVKSVETVLSEQGPRRAFALVRPPGHHAFADRATGFCLYNNVAIAAEHARQRLGVERVLIVDFDAHHGNGTHAIFERDPDVLCFDLHADSPVYPGTGSLFDTGLGEGFGATVNVPLPPNAGDSVFVEALDTVLRPVALRFLPDLILVSAGFDGHRSDLLMEQTEEGYAAMTARLCALAERFCDGRIAFVLEGGYRDALSVSVRACLRVLAGQPAPEIELGGEDPGRAALALATSFHARPIYWRKPRRVLKRAG